MFSKAKAPPCVAAWQRASGQKPGICGTLTLVEGAPNSLRPGADLGLTFRAVAPHRSAGKKRTGSENLARLLSAPQLKV